MLLHLHRNLHWCLCRVESAHARYKLWLGPSNQKFHRAFPKLHGLLEMHYDSIRTEMERSLTVKPHSTASHIFRRLGGVVSHLAIQKMVKEMNSVNPNDCDHTLHTSYGLMCACQLDAKLSNRRTVNPVHDLNVFWRTLHMGEPPEQRQQSVRDQFNEWARDRSENATEDEMRSYFDDTDASRSSLEEPIVNQRRGRPPRATGSRIPSSWEQHTPQSRRRNPTQPNTGSGSQASTGTSFRYQNQMPRQTTHFIRGWSNVISDGNCGFRVIAQLQYNDQDRWRDVRQDLMEELLTHRNMYNAEMGEARATEIANSLNWFAGPCNQPWWYTLPDMGCLTATKYQRVLSCYSELGSLTYLPLECRSQMDSPRPDPPSVHEEWTMGFVDRCHYIRLRVIDECPLPPLWRPWETSSEERISHWMQHYSVRLRQWFLF